MSLFVFESQYLAVYPSLFGRVIERLDELPVVNRVAGVSVHAIA